MSGKQTLERRIRDKLIESSTWFKEKEKEREEKPNDENIERNEKEKQQSKETNSNWKILTVRNRKNGRNVIKNITGKHMLKGEKSISEKKIEGIIFIQHTEYSE